MDDLQFGESFPFPRARWFSGLLWSAPVDPGLYGENAFERLVLTTNHRPTLARFGEAANAFPAGVLAMEAGGFSPPVAIAFDSVQDQKARGALKSLPASINPGMTRILIPRGLVQALGWQDQTKIEGYPIQIVLDDLSRLGEYITNPELKISDAAPSTMSGVMPEAVLRVMSGLALWLGQVLIFALPLLLFGWRSLLLGTVSLLVGTIVLVLFWRVLPGTGWLKGLVAGCGLGLVIGIGLPLAIETEWVDTLRFSFALWLATIWMGMVLTGARHK